MAETGHLKHSEVVGGGVLKLYERSSDRQEHLRVYVGPRNPSTSAGTVITYQGGEATARLYSGTGATGGRLELATVRDEPDWLARLWCEDEGFRRRWASLRLRALSESGGGGLEARTVLRLDAGGEAVHNRGRVAIYDGGSYVADEGGAKRATVYARLAIDEFGPFLIMDDGERWIQISPSGGIEAHPDKGDWSFVADHPEDPAAEIHYSVIEGPEVGVYVRGTARLEAGRASVILPDHFDHVASAKGLSVQLTPRSKASRGVAATTVSTRELVLEELFDGSGSYEVDYLLQGVKKGREGFEVVRPKRDRASRRGDEGARDLEQADG